STLNGQDAPVITRSQDRNHPSPIDDAISTCAPNGRARYFALLRLRLHLRDVLGVKVDQFRHHALQTRVRVGAAKKGIPSVVVYLEHWRVHEVRNSEQALRSL